MRLAKFQEAHYFYVQMVASQRDQSIFEYNLSAFLSAARSIIQHIEVETKGKREGHKWFSKYLSSKALISFMRDERNTNIHEKPVTTQSNVEFTKEPATIQFNFDNWTGPEDVVTLAQRYLYELTQMAGDGQQKGLLDLPKYEMMFDVAVASRPDDVFRIHSDNR